MTLSTSGMPAASTAPKTMTSTIRAAGTPKISAFSRSLLATLVIIWFRLASPVCASVKPVAGAGDDERVQLVDVLHGVVLVAGHDHGDRAWRACPWRRSVGSLVA